MQREPLIQVFKLCMAEGGHGWLVDGSSLRERLKGDASMQSSSTAQFKIYLRYRNSRLMLEGDRRVPRRLCRAARRQLIWGVSHLLHTKWPSHLRAFLDKLGNVEERYLIA